MKRFILINLLTLGLITSISAQTQVGFSGQIGVPVGDFGDEIDEIGYGFRANVLFPLFPKSPVFLGLDLGYLIYGSNVQQIRETIELTTSNGFVLDQFNIDLRVRTRNNLLNGGAVLRVKAPLPFVQPYLDGFVGLNYLYTRTKVFEEGTDRFLTDPDGTNVINAETQLNSVVFSYGGGGGVMFKVIPNLMIDARVLYILGNQAEYYDQSQTEDWRIEFSGTNYNDPSDLNNENTTVVSPDGIPKESRTDLISVNLGVTFSF